MKHFWWTVVIVLLLGELGFLAFAVYEFVLMIKHINTDESWANMVYMLLAALSVSVIQFYYNASIAQLDKMEGQELDG